MNYKNLFFISLFTMFIGVSFSTSPSPPPYYLLNVSGNVTSDSLNSVENYTIQLYGMSIDFQPEYEPIRGLFLGEERPIALTDSNGYYFIEVSNPFYLDSIKAGLIQPSKPIIFSNSIKIFKNELYEVTDSYANESNSGCNSCTSEPLYTGVVRYEFNYHGLDLEL